MRGRLSLPLIATSLPFLLGGFCILPSGNPSPPQASRCRPGFDAKAGAPTLGVEIGTRDDGSAPFAAWLDGSTARMFQGPQGGTMLPVWIRIAEQKAQCAAVDLVVTVDGQTAPLTESDGFTLANDGTTEAIVITLDFGAPPSRYAGRSAQIQATVATARQRGAVDLQVTLEL